MDLETAKKIVAEMEALKAKEPDNKPEPKPIDLDVEAIRVRDFETRDPHLLKRRFIG